MSASPSTSPVLFSIKTQFGLDGIWEDLWRALSIWKDLSIWQHHQLIHLSMANLGGLELLLTFIDAKKIGRRSGGHLVWKEVFDGFQWG